jgi:hypothetical protein
MRPPLASLTSTPCSSDCCRSQSCDVAKVLSPSRLHADGARGGIRRLFQEIQAHGEHGKHIPTDSFCGLDNKSCP